MHISATAMATDSAAIPRGGGVLQGKKDGDDRRNDPSKLP